ncbi:bifunctional 4-hydroxy-2-oxoglutarate aldolase/2-dehydro-3-deoxy-phosphogluconate aldolase [Kovacikia minuta CCNUW1]|uniref:bifunctional 4-hydroxy-2-oxoglutarate aldolase/2-dehydro-3-deoxy-phosphogluconate aldolase n=1 Tax=Kovacikia minuta TaxID=2931930 RepID=UPI001CCAF3A1|nr:bifunctional 4-hydroxy-2-oxoglutarate aldolase/2-dehydro-3-deoxy-phosphogluconate aldolase [Kovacikia minuta]UBF27309.1 bifunctional 4-hydroxy-2-oxoglutarate aldolase/2-dehydro-3-deoxy-phosphogluconate aldolase [Kovacikia minuta CCNUW1]
MPPSTWLTLLHEHWAIAVIRCNQLEQGQQMAQAVARGGIRLIEITWNSDRPSELIHRLRSTLPDCWIGAGTLLTQADVRDAIAAGAQFLFTPHVAPELIYLAASLNVPVVAGALSPTEIVQAWQAGAASVKVFPVQAMGGIEYIKSLQGPLGHIRLIPTGGVTVENAPAFLTVGAIAVGLSGSLFPSQAVIQGDWDLISRQAKSLIERGGSRRQEMRGQEEGTLPDPGS